MGDSARSAKSGYRCSKGVLGICVLMAFFFPTSFGGVQIEVIWGVINSLSMGIVLLVLFWRFGASRRGIVVAIAVALFLALATLIVVQGNVGEFSLARFAPAVLVLLLLALRLDSFRIDAASVIRLTDVLMWVIVLWNAACMCHVTWFEEFVVNYYTQLDDYTATQYSLLIGKPVFTFGVHNFASVFYLTLFYLSLRLFMSGNRRKRFFVYCVVLFVFTLMLRSTSAYGTAAVMLLLFAWQLWRHDKSAAKFFIAFLAIVGVLLIFTSQTVIERLLLDSNGFIPRYLNNELYFGNENFLKSYPLGLGFTIPSDSSIYLADSGFWIYRTMGNLPFLAGLIVLVILFITTNFKGEDRLFVAISILLAELSFASLLYWKTIFLLLILVVLLNSVPREKVSKDNEGTSVPMRGETKFE